MRISVLVAVAVLSGATVVTRTVWAIDCAQVFALMQQGHTAQEIAAAAGVNVADVQACRNAEPRVISPVGPPPLGAAGPAPLGAAGPAPRGAAGPPPLGAAGPAPFGTRR